ncbi:MAG: ThuA domain-containing protein [Planctomycetia bacterium]|nr:ThuA domain-containing protein [Planctomycetia bacterium]
MTRYTFLARLLVAAVVFASTGCAQAQDAAQPAAKGTARILFLTYSGTFKHGSVNRKEGQLAPAERAMTELGIKSNLFRVDCTQDPATAITKENLQNYDIVMFYTTGPRDKWKVSDENLEYFLNDWLKQKGHGFIGAHSAADTLGDYKPYWDMIGGTFNGHPWNSGETVTVAVHDQTHPLSKPWGPEFTIKDEIYRFKNWQPEKVRVLMSLDFSKTARKADYHVPVAWVKNYGEGKALHMSLGHNESVWENPTYMESLLGGVKWVLNLEPGDATPNPELSLAQENKAKADSAAAEKEKAKAAGK